MLKFTIELRRQRLIVREDERRALEFFDDIRHRKCLTRTRDAEQYLCAFALLYTRYELTDSFGLVAGGLEVGGDVERADNELVLKKYINITKHLRRSTK